MQFNPAPQPNKFVNLKWDLKMNYIIDLSELKCPLKGHNLVSNWETHLWKVGESVAWCTEYFCYGQSRFRMLAGFFESIPHVNVLCVCTGFALSNKSFALRRCIKISWQKNQMQKYGSFVCTGWEKKVILIFETTWRYQHEFTQIGEN